MAPLFSATSAITFLLVLLTALALRYLAVSVIPKAGKKHVPRQQTEQSLKSTKLSTKLKTALPDVVIVSQDGDPFWQSMNLYWAQQESEVIPACVVRPRDIQELSIAIKAIRDEHDERRSMKGTSADEGIFAIRSGGHSPVAGAASITGGVLIDLTFFCEVTLSENESSVVLGSAAKWMDVSKTLDQKGLAAVGGRNSAVGVGGLILGGGLSFYSPQFGLVCSNVISYELVLADGTITTASALINPDLWRALKGGSNNFGIVTRFTVPCFPSAKVWSGFLYMLPSQTQKVLSAFHEFVNRADSTDAKTSYDKYAAGPIACFSYVHQLGFQVVSVNLVHTKPPKTKNQWPDCWKSSSFSSLWRLWSTCKVQSLTCATDELSSVNPSGRRQLFATTTIKNDPATIAVAHTAYHDAIASLRKRKIKNLVWTLVLQPLLPQWVRKGDSNPQGLHDLMNEPLVIVSFTVNWEDHRCDEFVNMSARRAIEQMEAFAVAHGTGHRWRYLNYCAKWQKPFEGYGEENLNFLKDVSRKYDPSGLFQTGCVGGFKLGRTTYLDDSKAIA